MSRAQIAQARSWRELEGVTIPIIAKRLNVSVSTISKLFSKLGVTEGSRKKEIEQKTEAKVQQVLLGDAEKKAIAIKSAREESRASAAFLRKLIVKKVAEKAKANGDIGELSNEIKTLKEALAAVEIEQRVSFTSLGIKDGKDDDPDDIPELRVKEISDEEVQEGLQKQISDDIDSLDLDGEGEDLDDGIVDEGADGDDSPAA